MVWKPGDKIPKANSRKTIASTNKRQRKQIDKEQGIKRLPRARKIICMVCGRMMKAYSDKQSDVCHPCGRWMKKRREANNGGL